MNPFKKDGWNFIISLLLIVSLALSTGGCAAILASPSPVAAVMHRETGGNNCPPSPLDLSDRHDRLRSHARQ